MAVLRASSVHAPQGRHRSGGGVPGATILPETFNRWIARSREKSNQDLIRSSPVDFKYSHVSSLPERYSPRLVCSDARTHHTFRAQPKTNDSCRTFLPHLKDLFGLPGPKFATPPRLIAHRFIAEDDIVVVEARENFLTRTGVANKNSYCYIVRVSDGKMQEITEYMDTELATRTVGAPSVP